MCFISKYISKTWKKSKKDPLSHSLLDAMFSFKLSAKQYTKFKLPSCQKSPSPFVVIAQMRSPFPDPESKKAKQNKKTPNSMMNNIVQNIPRMMSHETRKRLCRFFRQEHNENDDDMTYVWVIRPRYSYEYFSVQDDSEHHAIVAFHDKHLAEKTRHAMVDYHKQKDDENIYKKARQPLIIEKLELSFLHYVCDTTSLNLIIFYARYNEESRLQDIVTKKFWFVREAPENIRLILEQRIKLS